MRFEFRRGGSKKFREPKVVDAVQAQLALARALGGPRAEKAVQRIVDHPERFIARTRDDFAQDFEPDDRELPWVGLLFTLAAQRRVAEFDRKDGGEAIMRGLGRVGGPQAVKALALALDDELKRRGLEEAFALAAGLLGERRLALVELPSNSDTTWATIVPVADVHSLITLGRRAGHSLLVWTDAGLEKAQQLRRKKEAGPARSDAWKALLDARRHITRKPTVDDVIFELRYPDEADELLPKLEAALPSVPAKDRPVVEHVLALWQGSPVKLARSTKDPASCLRALAAADQTRPLETVQAAAILAARLRVKGDRGTLHEQVVCALNFWDDQFPESSAKKLDPQLARLPRADLARLARLCDEGIGKTGGGLTDALYALKTVGDATSLTVLEHLAQRAEKRGDELEDDSPLPIAIDRIRRRLR
jgi:hypothetical protein